MNPRQRARLLTVQFLFQVELNEPEDIKASFQDFISLQDEPVEAKAKEFAWVLIRGVRHNQQSLDERLKGLLEHWSMERLSGVDRNILRLAAFEILHREDIPPMVSLNEAINLAKSFGSEDSGRFVNGILDKVMHLSGRPLRSPGKGTA